MDSEFNEKMDTLDLIITALKDHEKRLDDISNRLEDLFNILSINEEKPTKTEEPKKESAEAKEQPSIVCSKWNEFKTICKDAKIAAFEVEDKFFNVYSKTNGEIIKYTEELPRLYRNNKLKVVEEESGFIIDKESIENIEQLRFLIDRRLNCGLTVLVRGTKNILNDNQFIFELTYDLDPREIREFLSKELGIPKGSIIEGKITY